MKESTSKHIMIGGKRFAATAMSCIMAMSMVPSLAFAGTASSEDTATLSGAASADGYVIGAAFAAAEPTPDLLGLSNPEERNTSTATDMKLTIFGTDINENPDPYFENQYRTLALGEDDTPRIITSNRSGSPMSAMPDYDTTGVKSGSNAVWALLPDVIIGTGSDTIPSNEATYYDSAARGVEKALNLETNSYNPIGVTYDRIDLNTMINTMYRTALAADEVVENSTGTKALRYGSAMDIAKQYERYIIGAKGAVLKALDAGTTTKKLIASVNSYDAASDTYQINTEGVAEGTATTNRLLEAVQGVTTNLYDVSTGTVASDSTKTVTPSELATCDVLIYGGQSTSGNVIQALTDDGLLSKTFYATNMSSGSIFGTTVNSTENAQNIGRVLSCVYPDVLDQSDMVAYYYDYFYHLKTDAVASTIDTYMDGVRNWDATETASYLQWDESTVAGYSAEAVEKILSDGIDYLNQKIEKEGASSVPSYMQPSGYLSTSSKDISKAEVAAVDDQAYTGSAIEPALTVKLDGKTLSQGTDFTVVYENNTNLGTATATITGAGAYTGTLTASFNIVAADLSSKATGAAIATIGLQTYTGSEVTPAPKVTIGKTTLTAGTDYTVAYSNNTNVGTATVVVTGTGNYKGSLSTTFTISSVIDMNDVTVAAIADQTYTGKAITPEPKITANVVVPPSISAATLMAPGGVTLVKDVDYTLTYKDNTVAGTATITIEGNGTSTTGSITKEFTIAKADLTKATVTVSDQAYTGEALEPAPTVSISTGSGRNAVTTTYSKDDYDVTYSNNTEAGTATVTVTGKDNCTGTATGTFEIYTIKDISTLDATIEDQNWTGAAIEAMPVVKDGDKTLTLGTDYTVSFKNNVDAGVAQAIITAKSAKYTGTKTVNFNIIGTDIKDTTIDAIADQTYTGEAIEPDLVIKDGDKTLVRDTDYTVSFADNTNVGTATATITGKGGYTGTTTVQFKINAASIKDASITAVSDQTYNGKAIEPNLVIKIGDKALVRDTDYTVSFADNTNVGTATATITGKGGYTGTTTVQFKINAADLKDASIAAISDQNWTGSEVKPSLNVTVGGNELVEGVDYTVAYKNNVLTGIATATITGIGNCTGTNSATFQIVKGTAGSEIRLAGDNAMGTMTQIVKSGWQDGSCDTVVLATFDGYWDALSASSLAGLYQCPVLLTWSNSLASEALTQITRLGATKVIIAGGTSAVSSDVEAALKAKGIAVTRAAGENAAGTAVEAYKAGQGSWSDTCVIATSDGYYDALSASPYAYSQNAPIFLTNWDGTLTSDTVSAIKDGKFTNVVIAGGTSVVSSAIENQLKDLGCTVTRCAGDNCFGTSKKIAELGLASGMTMENVGYATGLGGYWDSLTGAALCGKNNSPLLLIDEGYESDALSLTKSQGGAGKAVVFGGSAALSDAVVSDIAAAVK